MSAKEIWDFLSTGTRTAHVGANNVRLNFIIP